MQFTEPPRAFVRMNSLNALSFKRDHFLIDNKILLHFTTQSTRTRLTFDEFRTFIAMRKSLKSCRQSNCRVEMIESNYFIIKVICWGSDSRSLSCAMVAFPCLAKSYT